jgi:hypothetical protein
MAIKKQFEELLALLQANENKKISTILPQVLTLVSSNQKSTIIRNDEGEVTHIFCYYHKEWESVDLYGHKQHSASGYNTMCKQGVNQWSKQQREAKKSRDAVLQGVADGTIDPQNLTQLLADIEATRVLVNARTE